jgi:RNA polymerase sigma-70 factor, ECF subfamily
METNPRVRDHATVPVPEAATLPHGGQPCSRGDVRLADPGDEELVRRANAGDAAAADALFRRHWQFAFTLASWLLRNHQADASDVAQEALLAAFRYLRTFNGRSTFRTWLTRIVSSEALDLLKERGQRRARERRAAEAGVGVPRPARSPLEELSERELPDAIRRILMHCPDGVRLAYQMSCEGWTLEEIGKELGVCARTAGRTRDRALERVRSRLPGLGWSAS